LAIKFISLSSAVLKLNGISIPSTIFAGLTTATDNRPNDRQTDRPCYSVCNNRPHLRTYYCDEA